MPQDWDSFLSNWASIQLQEDFENMATSAGVLIIGAGIRPGIYVCGDHRDNASIQGAMLSGRRAAEAVLADLAG